MQALPQEGTLPIPAILRLRALTPATHLQALTLRLLTLRLTPALLQATPLPEALIPHLLLAILLLEALIPRLLQATLLLELILLRDIHLKQGLLTHLQAILPREPRAIPHKATRLSLAIRHRDIPASPIDKSLQAGSFQTV